MSVRLPVTTKQQRLTRSAAVFVNASAKHSVSKHILKGMKHPYVAPVVLTLYEAFPFTNFFCYQKIPEIDGKLVRKTTADYSWLTLAGKVTN